MRYAKEKIPYGIQRYVGEAERLYGVLDTRLADRDFVVDRLSGHPRIAVAVGAGHAAKFAGALGRILSELVLDGATSSPIDSFRADRPALVDPGFVPTYRLAGSPVPT